MLIDCRVVRQDACPGPRPQVDAAHGCLWFGGFRRATGFSEPSLASRQLAVVSVGLGDYVLSYFDHTLVLKKGDIGLQGPPCFNSLLMCKAGGAHACTTAKVNCIPWLLVIKKW